MKWISFYFYMLLSWNILVVFRLFSVFRLVMQWSHRLVSWTPSWCGLYLSLEPQPGHCVGSLVSAIPSTLTSVLQGFLAVAKSSKYKEASRIKKLEFHAIPTGAEIGKCKRLWNMHWTFLSSPWTELNQTKHVKKPKYPKIDGGTNKGKRNEEIYYESAASQQHVY